MRKGVIHIVEVLITIMLMFTLMSTLVRQNPPIQGTGGMENLQRYATDGANMLCNCDRARNIVMSDSGMDWIEESMNYSMPENMGYKVTVLNTAGSIIKDAGADLPTDNRNIATSSCTMSTRGKDPRQLVVSVWR